MNEFSTEVIKLENPLTQQELEELMTKGLRCEIAHEFPIDVQIKFEENLKKSIFETGDMVALEVYTKLKSTIEYTIYDNYARVFGLCRLLGVTNLYDIGCGDSLQAFLLISHQNMSYTGIDCATSIDFTYINELFGAFCGERIKFQKAEYPFAITPARHNAAISCFALGTLIRDKQSIKNTAVALSRDFERILLNIYNENFKIWETELTYFNLYKIGDAGFVFGTKFPEDITKLQKVGYNCFDNLFTIGFNNAGIINYRNRLF